MAKGEEGVGSKGNEERQGNEAVQRMEGSSRQRPTKEESSAGFIPSSDNLTRGKALACNWRSWFDEEGRKQQLSPFQLLFCPFSVSPLSGCCYCVFIFYYCFAAILFFSFKSVSLTVKCVVSQ